MPYLNIVINKPVNNEALLLKAASQAVSEATGKAETYIMVSLDNQPNMIMAGTDDILAFLDYRALGLPTDRNAFSAALCQMIADQLSIPGERIYISMTDSERQNWGWNYQTF